jgi:hypothetical protein
MDIKDMTDDERDLATELGRLGRIHARAARPPPPPQLDEAILARSREAVRARQQPRRWWIPASVAATALIAFSLVTRIQQEVQHEPPATEAATAAAPPAIVADSDEQASQAADASRPSVAAAVPADGSAETAPLAATPLAAPAAEARPAQEALAVQADAPAAKRTVPPRQAMPRRAPAASAADEPPTGAPSAEQESSLAAPNVEDSGQIAPAITPEAWLQKIEALEAQGRTEEAARQRALLEQAYPGWLAGRAAPH